MPTREVLDSFWRDWDRLTPDEQEAFVRAAKKFIADLRTGRGFRPGLRVKGVMGAAGIYEMTWADDGRATFSFGQSRRAGEPHIVWRRIGSHEIFRNA
jgi:hypothetical protein